jgi:hypothetical protein
VLLLRQQLPLQTLLCLLRTLPGNVSWICSSVLGQW